MAYFYQFEDATLRDYPKCHFRPKEQCPEPAGCQHQVGEFACAFKSGLQPALVPRKLCYLMGRKSEGYDDSWEPALMRIFPNRFRRRCEMLVERQPCRCPDLSYSNRRDISQFTCGPRTAFESLESRLSPCICPCEVPMYEFKEQELDFCYGASGTYDKIKEKDRERKLIVTPKQQAKTEKEKEKRKKPKKLKLIKPKPKPKPKKKKKIPQQSGGEGVLKKNKNP